MTTNAKKKKTSEKNADFPIMIGVGVVLTGTPPATFDLPLNWKKLNCWLTL